MRLDPVSTPEVSVRPPIVVGRQPTVVRRRQEPNLTSPCGWPLRIAVKHRKTSIVSFPPTVCFFPLVSLPGYQTQITALCSVPLYCLLSLHLCVIQPLPATEEWSRRPRRVRALHYVWAMPMGPIPRWLDQLRSGRPNSPKCLFTHRSSPHHNRSTHHNLIHLAEIVEWIKNTITPSKCPSLIPKDDGSTSL